VDIQDVWPIGLAIAAVITGIALAITGFSDRNKKRRPDKDCKDCMEPTLNQILDCANRTATKLGEMKVFFEGTTKSQVGHLEEIQRLCVEILRNGRKRD